MKVQFRTGLIALAVAAALFSQTVARLAVTASNDQSTYYGGTIPEFKDAKNPVEGRLVATDETALQFIYKKTQMVSIPYAKFIDIEYGQKSGRRVGAAIAVRRVRRSARSAVKAAERPEGNDTRRRSVDCRPTAAVPA